MSQITQGPPATAQLKTPTAPVDYSHVMDRVIVVNDNSVLIGF